MSGCPMANERVLSDEQVKALLEAARAARSRAYAPYSHFAVGAAVLSADGRIFSGANVENAAYPQGWCAECSALAAMIGAGARSAVAALIAGGPEGAEEIPCTPCGGCRQKLFEFAAGGDMDIYVLNDRGSAPRYRPLRLSSLLPRAFGPAALHRTIPEEQS